MIEKNKKLKILVVNYEYPPIGGGGGVVCSQLCKEFVKLGHEVDVVTMGFKKLPKEQIEDGVRIFRVPCWRSTESICKIHELVSFVIPAFLKCSKLIRINKYDIIHSHFIFPSAVPAWLTSKLTKTPLVVTCHGSDVPGYNKKRFIWAHNLLAPIWKLFSSMMPLISPSNSLKSLILKGNTRANVTVINNGIDFTRYKDLKKENRILCCSRILDYKGIQYLIDAVKNMDQGLKVDIVGNGPYLETLKEQAKNSKTPIKFHGWLPNYTPEFINLFEKSSFFVFPSEFENFPTVLLEAMASGNAIITTKVGGIEEVVGDCALFVPTKDSDAIHEKLLLLLDNPNLKINLQEKSKKRASEFTWNNIAQKHINFFRKQIR